MKQLPQEKIYEVARCFQPRFMALEDAPSSWRIVKLVLRKPDAAPKKERDQTSTRSGNETRSKAQDETHPHEILIHSRFGISETANDVISQD